MIKGAKAKELSCHQMNLTLKDLDIKWQMKFDITIYKEGYGKNNPNFAYKVWSIN